MCGIVAVISKDSDLSVIKEMTEAVAHRGPDDAGYYFGNDFAFGHRRLSIVDLSSGGRQPMEYLNRYIIIFNGEIYNHIELRTELRVHGYEFATETDTEVILAAFDKWGVDCLARFNGMWAFVLFDKNRRKFFISRDRLGKKPLYYCRTQQAILFASEIKSLLKYPGIKTSANQHFLKDYIENGARAWIRETSFTNIFRFNSASFCYGAFEELACGINERKYWKIVPNVSQEKFDESKLIRYANTYYDLLRDAVKIRLRADVKVGSALSGGLDSSSIVYLVDDILRAEGKGELQETFSSVYRTPGTLHCDESTYIAAVTSTLKVKSHEIEPTEEDVRDLYRLMISSIEDPPENSGMSGWNTFRLVSSTDVKVTLDGQGADEQLAGYVGYIMIYLASLPITQLLVEAPSFLRVPGAKRLVLFGAALGIARAALGGRYLKMLLRRVLKRDWEFNLNRLLAKDTTTSLATLMHYLDHTSMAYSIESRSPFLDYRVVEFLASVPSCYKVRKGWTKYVARVAFNGRLPDSICWRRDKIGWGIPEAHWFLGNLNGWARERIRDSSLLAKLDPDLGADDAIEARIGLRKFIRYLNVAVWEECFADKFAKH